MKDMTNKSEMIAAQSTRQNTTNRKSKASLLLGLGIGLAVVITGLSSCENSGKSNKETEVYNACSSIADYRAYMNTYGAKGKYYKDAKNVVDRYVADSVEKAQTRERKWKKEEAEEECFKKYTTVAGCETYLKEYPQGKYVEEVIAMQQELEAANEKALKVENEMYSKCTTIAGCESYLKAYPQGRFVTEVQKMKAELELKEKGTSGKKLTVKPEKKAGDKKIGIKK